METRQEVREKLRRATRKFLLENWVQMLLEGKAEIVDVNEFIGGSPSEVLDTLYEDLGWEYEMLDSNGWEQDTDYELSHPMYRKKLRLSYSGFYWTMHLTVKDD